MDISVGLTHTETVTVDQNNIASAVGSGLVDVFATPMMVALLELAASHCIQPCLDPGQASVGTHIDISHSAATPAGMQVSATATVVEVDRKRVEFSITVQDGQGEVGRGTHTRFVVNKAAFMEKANEKKSSLPK